MSGSLCRCDLPTVLDRGARRPRRHAQREVPGLVRRIDDRDGDDAVVGVTGRDLEKDRTARELDPDLALHVLEELDDVETVSGTVPVRVSLDGTDVQASTCNATSRSLLGSGRPVPFADGDAAPGERSLTRRV